MRLLDTSDAFEAFARKAFVEVPVIREQLWEQRYESAVPEVFEAFYARSAERRGRAAVVRELSDVRTRARAAAPVVRDAIERVEPTVQTLLGVAPETSPLHVLMVGPYSTNAVVGPMGDDVAVFHCLEWFHPDQATDVLVAHEDTHAWHEIVHGEAVLAEDTPWMAFAEGLAIGVSRAAVPGRPDDDYFWYGHERFEAWLPWCQEHRDELVGRFAADIETPEAAETWFGSGLVDKQWRVGYFVADQLVSHLSQPLDELAALTPDEGRQLILDILT
ncbi:hypothetical protein BH18ACT4_BH18ACT4_15210 [soil metagenome]